MPFACARPLRAAAWFCPPLFGGVGGVDEPYTVVMDVEPTFTSALLEPWIMRLCEELKRIGFQAIIILTGHYGASQQMIVREVAVRQMQRLDIPILGTPEYFLAMDVGYTGDHGGAFETSLMMELMPELVDINQLEGDPPYKGIGGGDARRDSNRELGARFADTIVERLARLAGRMPQWDELTRRRFLRAEQALVSQQLEAGGRAGDVWAAWLNMAPMLDYGRMVADEQFEDIETLVRTRQA